MEQQQQQKKHLGRLFIWNMPVAGKWALSSDYILSEVSPDSNLNRLSMFEERAEVSRD